MTDTWDTYAEEWDSLAATYAEKAYGALLAQCKLRNKRILDFGCGTGLLSQRLATEENDIVALDSSSKMIEKLQEKKIPRVTALKALLNRDLIVKTECLQQPFDAIVASSVCAFLPNYRETVSLLHSLLLPGGTFFQWDWLTQEEDSDTGFTELEVQNMLTQVGFTNIRTSIPFSIASPEGTMPVLMAIAKKQ